MKHQGITAITIFLLLGSVLCGACQRFPQKEIPAPNLEERQKTLDAVKKALARLDKGSPNTVVELINHQDYRVRRAAIAKAQALELKTPAAAQAIINRLADDHPRVRSRAVRALAVMEVTEAIEPMIPLLVDSEADVRLFASKSLRKFGDPGFQSLIMKLADDGFLDKHSFVQLDTKEITLKEITLKERIITTLAIGGTRAVPALVTALSHTNPAVRTRVPEVISELGRDAKNAVTPMLEALDRNDQPLREAIAASLGPLGPFDTRVVTKLQQLKNDSNRTVAQNAARSLAVVSRQEAKTQREKKGRERKLKQQRARREAKRKVYDGRPKK